MIIRGIAALGALAGAAAVAGGQGQTATYHLIFTSPTASNGNGTANISFLPGVHVVTAQVMVSFSPGVGQPANGPGTLNGTVTGLAYGGFDLSGAGPAGVGVWLPPTAANLQPPYNFFFGNSAGTVAGYSINNAQWGTGAPFPAVHPSPENPDNVLTYTFITTGTIGFISFAFPGGPAGFINTGVWIHNPEVGPWPFSGVFITNGGQGGSIFVHPTPNVVTVLGLGGLVALRCRR